MEENWAVIGCGGHQHLVGPKSKLTVNRENRQLGDEFTLPSLTSGEPVRLKVVSHLLGKKINGLKFRPKVRYLRRYGHRQMLTELEVVSIGQRQPVSKAVSKSETKKKRPPAKIRTK